MTLEITPSIAHANLAEEDRLLLAAGLARLIEDMTDKHPLLAHVVEMRETLLAGTVLSELPQHVTFNEADLQELLSYLANSEYWTIYWEFGAEDGKYDLIAEIAVGGDISHFNLAEGLVGKGAFEIDDNDLQFVERLRSYVRMWAPATSDELEAAVIEVPVSWTALESMCDDGTVLESYLETITSQSGVYGVMTRGSLGDVHSHLKLGEAEYAGLKTLAIGSRRQLDALPSILSGYEDSLLNPVCVPGNR